MKVKAAAIVTLIILVVLLVACASPSDGNDAPAVVESPCWEIDWERLGVETPPPPPTREPGDDSPLLTWCTPVPE